MSVSPSRLKTKYSWIMLLLMGGMISAEVYAADPSPTPGAAHGATSTAGSSTAASPSQKKEGGGDDKPMHYSANQQRWFRKEGKIELIGRAVINRPGEHLTSDYAVIDTNLRTLDAKGNCVYITPNITIYGEEMHINLDTSTGIVLRGQVFNERFSLIGDEIHKLSSTRFQVKDGRYSTCHDCPRSWVMQANGVDMEVEGYAQMYDVTAQVKDAPLLWSPYLIIPVKTKRQTGFLFPRFGASMRDGFVFVEPFFWAINRSSDMTIGLGRYSERGKRVEWEGRYALTDGEGESKIFYQADKTFERRKNRLAIDLALRQSLPLGFQAKLKATEASDNRYPSDFEDIKGRGEPVLPSRLMVSGAAAQLSGYAEARRMRNLLYGDPLQFDPKTVQLMPAAVLSSNDQFLFGTPIATGLSLGVSRFARSSGPYDYDPSSIVGSPIRQGVDPIREATRISAVPRLYTTLRPFSVFSVVPSAEYRYFAYSFAGQMGGLTRGYLQLQTDFSTQLDRVFELADPDIPRVKHLVRPNLTYSLIPPSTVRAPDHPFQKQMDRRDGYNFDNYDRVPIDNSTSQVNYFVPLGHSLSYGLKSQLIRRRGALDELNPSYQTSIEFTAGQTYNFRELRKSEESRRPLSRIFSTLTTAFDQFSTNTQYYYYPYIEPFRRHSVTTGVNYLFERGVRQNVLVYERSFGVNYTYNRLSSLTSSASVNTTYSINDYILPSLSVGYDFAMHRRLFTRSNVAFQSPSRCWRFTLGFENAVDRPGAHWSTDLSLNLTGAGFAGVGETQDKYFGTKEGKQ